MGTLKPGDSKNEDVYTKKHTFKLADVSQNKTLFLENLKATPFVALYTDETGNTRVSGSPDYPLTFSFEIGKFEGMFFSIDVFVFAVTWF